MAGIGQTGLSIYVCTHFLFYRKYLYMYVCMYVCMYVSMYGHPAFGKRSFFLAYILYICMSVP
jgi:hypothetical protein